MAFFITFLEGVISFLSPCTLPLLPVYIGYFSGASAGRDDAGPLTAALPGAAAFTVGFAAVFCALGVFAGTLGRLLLRYQGAVNLVCGGIVVILGLSFLDILPLPQFQTAPKARQVTGLLSALLFGMVYAVTLTPCAGAFLGAALMLASSSGGAGRGAALLLCYSLGLGVPFLLSALLIDQLKGAFDAVKRHYALFQRVCGGFLIAVGLCMAAGWMNRLLAAFSVL